MNPYFLKHSNFHADASSHGGAASERYLDITRMYTTSLDENCAVDLVHFSTGSCQDLLDAVYLSIMMCTSVLFNSAL